MTSVRSFAPAFLAAAFAAVLLVCVSVGAKAASPGNFAPGPETASGDFLVKKSEASGEIETLSPDGIGGKSPLDFDGLIGSPYCHNDPINKYDYLGLEGKELSGEQRRVLKLLVETQLEILSGLEGQPLTGFTVSEFAENHSFPSYTDSALSQVNHFLSYKMNPVAPWRHAAGRFPGVSEYRLHDQALLATFLTNKRQIRNANAYLNNDRQARRLAQFDVYLKMLEATTLIAALPFELELLSGRMIAGETIAGTASREILKREALGYVNGRKPQVGISQDVYRALRSKFRMRSIADNPTYLRLWEQAKTDAIASNLRRNGQFNVYRRFVDGEDVNPEAVFNYIRGRFVTLAENEGARLPTHGRQRTILPIHHWNWNKSDFSAIVVDPRHLFFTPPRFHNSTGTGIHQFLQTPGLNPTRDPIPPHWILDVESPFLNP